MASLGDYAGVQKTTSCYLIVANYLPLRVLDGNIMKYTSRNPTYFSSSKPLDRCRAKICLT